MAGKLHYCSIMVSMLIWGGVLTRKTLIESKYSVFLIKIKYLPHTQWSSTRIKWILPGYGTLWGTIMRGCFGERHTLQLLNILVLLFQHSFFSWQSLFYDVIFKYWHIQGVIYHLKSICNWFLILCQALYWDARIKKPVSKVHPGGYFV